MKSIFLLLLTLSFFLNCQKTQDSDLTNAAVLMGSVNRSLGSAQRAGATGAVAALSAAGSGLSTGATAFLNPMIKQFMLASRDRRYGSGRRLAARNQVRPTAFTCSGAACSGSGSFVLDGGPETCADGTGTVAVIPTFNVTVVNDGEYINYTTDGKFSYQGNCGAYSVDFEDYPNYKLVRLAGNVKTVGSITTTITETSTTESGFFFAHTQVTTTSADDFKVDGGSAIIMDVRVDEVVSENILFDPNTDEIEAGIASGTISMIGTVNGHPVAINSSFVENMSE